MKRLHLIAVTIATALAALTAHADIVKVAVIDAASGPMGATSIGWTRYAQIAVDNINKRKLAGDNTIELTQFDNKGSTQESLVQLRSAIEQGYRYIMQGGSSSAAAALIDAINKHNARNPGKEVLLLIHSSADPELTNALCSFWHFRFQPHTEMMVEGLVSEIVKRPEIKRLYVIGQNYPMGQSVAKSVPAYLKRRNSNIEVVGNELIPLLQVKDFSPYVAKIKASGADSLLTFNYGPDLALLLKAIRDSGLKIDLYTFSSLSLGIASNFSDNLVGHLKNIQLFVANNPGFKGHEVVEAFKAKYDTDFISSTPYLTMQYLGAAIKQSKSTDPMKVAYAMEGMKVDSLGGESEMRKSDHQVQSPMFIASLAKVDGKDVRYPQENSDYALKYESRIEAFSSSQPTSCQMTRPAPR